MQTIAVPTTQYGNSTTILYEIYALNYTEARPWAQGKILHGS